MAKAKILKKEWHPILAPKIFQSAVLGETHVYDPEQMIGKGITANLMGLTNDVKRQNININFEVSDIQNGKAITNVVGYYMVQSSIKRMIRRNIEKINMSFPCKTSDNKNIQLKPLLITRSATTGSVATRMRRNAQDLLVKHISSMSYDNLVNDLVNHKLQNSLRKTLSKIYPLRVCEIMSMKIVDLEKKEQVKSKAKSEKKEKSVKKAEEKVKEGKEAPKKEEKVEKQETKTEQKPEQKEKKPEQSA
tara:strand:- start:344 stop:1087 length:744 start_codon:yes stop_codon:yes gene_type:complete